MPTKRFEVARILEKSILCGGLRPGGRLRELKLATELGVSQATVREALQHLESLGLVVKYPNRGSFVINLEPEDIIQIYQVRRELEPLACALAARSMRKETDEALRQCLMEMQGCAEIHNYQGFSNADLEFHRAIWQAQPNRYLEKYLQSICLPLFAYDLIVRYSNAYINFDLAIRQHQHIWSAMRTGDPALVSKVVRRLIDRFMRQNLADFERLRQVSEQLMLGEGEISVSPLPGRGDKLRRERG